MDFLNVYAMLVSRETVLTVQVNFTLLFEIFIFVFAILLVQRRIILINAMIYLQRMIHFSLPLL